MNDDSIPDPQRLLKLAKQTMSSAERRKKYNRISFMGPSFFYPSQMAFLNRTQGDHHRRILTGGNQSGKTTTCGAELSWHLTGRYPDWFTGLRFNQPITAWCIVQSATLDIFWCDEKPPNEIYSELLARLTASGGHTTVSFTAIGNDADGFVHKLWEERSSDQQLYFIPASETAHISEVRREELAKSYDEAEVATRVHGHPDAWFSLLPGLTRWFD